MTPPPAGGHVLIMCAAGSAENANRIANDLVANRLAACVQLYPIESVYRWDDAVRHDAEIMFHIKTTSARAAEVEGMIKSAHTYDLPEISMVELSGGSPDYLAWITESVRA